MITTLHCDCERETRNLELLPVIILFLDRAIDHATVGQQRRRQSRMVRFSIAIALIAALASCGGDKAFKHRTAKASISTQGCRRYTAWPKRCSVRVCSTVIIWRDGPNLLAGMRAGCQAGAVQLPETGPTWQAMRLSRNRNWAQPQHG